MAATPAGTDLLTRQAEVGSAWLAERLKRLGQAERACLERVVTLLESLATERPGDASDVDGGRHDATHVSQ